MSKSDGVKIHTHDNYAVDSAESLRPCQPFEHGHAVGRGLVGKTHEHILTGEVDGRQTAGGTDVVSLTGIDLDTELLRRAAVAYPEYGQLIANIGALGLRSAGAAGLRENLGRGIEAIGEIRVPLKKADVSQIRYGTFERIGGR